jgi:hypothetical protein
MKTAVAALLAFACSLQAQTYKLGVPPHAHPAATLKVDGGKVQRGPVTDDPGFRLRFHVLKDGKSLSTHDARAVESIDLPSKEPGAYAAVLELFYPSYKPGKETKGQFKAISPYVLYQVVSAGAPIKLIEREPVLILDCGNMDGKAQETRVGKGYGYKLIQGKPLEGWPATVARTHAWMDPKAVRFEISLPPETAGTLRLHLVDGDAAGRKCKVTIQGRGLPALADFGGAGKRTELPVSIAETKPGKIEVAVETLESKAAAVVSVIEFVPAFAP